MNRTVKTKQKIAQESQKYSSSQISTNAIPSIKFDFPVWRIKTNSKLALYQTSPPKLWFYNRNGGID